MIFLQKYAEMGRKLNCFVMAVNVEDYKYERNRVKIR